MKYFKLLDPISDVIFLRKLFLIPFPLNWSSISPLHHLLAPWGRRLLSYSSLYTPDPWHSAFAPSSYLITRLLGLIESCCCSSFIKDESECEVHISMQCTVWQPWPSGASSFVFTSMGWLPKSCKFRVSDVSLMMVKLLNSHGLIFNKMSHETFLERMVMRVWGPGLL